MVNRLEALLTDDQLRERIVERARTTTDLLSPDRVGPMFERSLTRAMVTVRY